ncbi:hypothetical protein K466DRAFT_587759 [Polyporus arcularius HHB13444]|uniref:Uncharacterized protein n=1 Tax=Polyporus arcularius HHB13444 TaxID=1314778 RepID=A0A5C3PAA6_9APHY|nr:hypothetical protein K466DRAFT_587759 [Polyporus arcularius HHB13444]
MVKGYYGPLDLDEPDIFVAERSRIPAGPRRHASQPHADDVSCLQVASTLVPTKPWIMDVMRSASFGKNVILSAERSYGLCWAKLAYIPVIRCAAELRCGKNDAWAMSFWHSAWSRRPRSRRDVVKSQAHDSAR